MRKFEVRFEVHMDDNHPTEGHLFQDDARKQPVGAVLRDSLMEYLGPLAIDDTMKMTPVEVVELKEPPKVEGSGVPPYLVKHIRDDFGVPFATIVAISPTQIGLSICNKSDRFSKLRGTVLAYKRAMDGEPCSIPHRKDIDAALDWGESASDLIQAEIYSMLYRAERYFK